MAEMEIPYTPRSDIKVPVVGGRPEGGVESKSSVHLELNPKTYKFEHVTKKNMLGLSCARAGLSSA